MGIMRHKYTQQVQLQHQQHAHRSTFLPMLCSSSVKEIKPSHRRSSSTSSSNVSDEPRSPKVGCMGQVRRNNKVGGLPTIISFSSISITSGISSTHTTLRKDHQQNGSNNMNIAKYQKLRRFFSNKSLTNSPTSTTGARATKIVTQKANACRSNSVRSNNIVNSTGREVRSDHLGHHGRILLCRSKTDENNIGGLGNNSKGICKLNLEELDPPLPVIKKVELKSDHSGENASLWKRRSGGLPLKTLQVQVVQQQCQTILPANTV